MRLAPAPPGPVARWLRFLALAWLPDRTPPTERARIRAVAFQPTQGPKT